MELDVCLTRTGDQQWGFRLIGGTDFGMPLTVVKIFSSSPAEKAGLRHGDALCCINGDDAAEMTHDDSRAALAGAGESLSLKVVRGLYDPVLDDTEPLFEPIDQADFDQPSIPTEVEYLDVPQKLPQYEPSPLPDLIDPLLDRSLTASPFVPQLKPYRPFSTEPVEEIPPLEDPIILNPGYHDEFGRIKDEIDFLPVTKFKLPISEQYDPDGTKHKGKLQDETKETTVKIQEEREVKKYEETEMKEQVMTKEETRFLEEMKKEIDVETIELTATSIVDESIEKALTVAEEIKKEVMVALSKVTEASEIKSINDTSLVESTARSEVSLSNTEERVIKDTAIIDAVQLTELLDKTTEEIIKQNERRSAHLEHTEQVTKTEEQESKLEVSVKDTEKVSSKLESNASVKKDEVRQTIEESSAIKQQESVIQESNVHKRSEHMTRGETTDEKYTTDKKYSTSKLLSEQRAYTIGLQTIPNIRGNLHSSYHYDLLLKTFFIHLTDVMVALSRFILNEPVLTKSESGSKTQTTENISRDVTGTMQETVQINKQDIVKQDVIKQKTAEQDKQEVVIAQDHKKKVAKIAGVEIHEEAKQKDVSKAFVDQKLIEKKAEETTAMKIKEKQVHKQRIEESNHFDVTDSSIGERKVCSGSKMAQRTEKKSEELMHKMEAVITEFESKSGGENIEIVRERRSRSRSRAEEALHEDVDMTIEEKHLLGEERTSEHLTETYSSSAMSSSTTESRFNRKSDSVYDTADYQTSQSKEGNTYLAIVEAHVYTNKDAIFDERLEVEKTSVQEISEVKKDVAKTEDIQKIKTAEKDVKTEHAIDKKQQILKEKKEIKDVENILVTENKVSKEKELKHTAQMYSEKDVSTVQKEEKVQIQPTVEIPKAKVVIPEEIAKAEVIIATDQKAEEVKSIKKDYVKNEDKVVIQEIFEPFIDSEEILNDYHVTEAKEETTVVAKQECIATEVVMASEEKVTLREEVKPKSILKDHVATFKDSVMEHKQENKQESVTIKEDKMSTKEAVTCQEIIETSTIENLISKDEMTAFKVEESLGSIKEETKSEKIEVSDEIVAIKNSYVEKNDFKEVKQSEITVEKAKEFSVKEENLSVLQASEMKKVNQSELTFEKEIGTTVKDVTSLAVKASEFTESTKKEETNVEEAAELKVVKKEIIEQQRTNIDLKEEIDLSYKKVEVKQFQNHVENIESKLITQESTFVAKSVEPKPQKLSLDLPKQETKTNIVSDEKNNIETPTPPYVPTPLTDEYIFKLEIPLAKREGDPIPRDCTPSDDEEDPHIVKKGLVPIMDVEIGERKIFDPPLPTPPVTPGSPRSPKSPQSPRSPTSPRSPKFPVYTKPGLRGGADRDYSKEEILEIERKSSLLASAIDETIKSIEEYKEEVGINQEHSENHIGNGVIYNGYAKVLETKIFDTVNQVIVNESKNTNDRAVQEKIIMDKIEETKKGSEVIEEKTGALIIDHENIITESLLNNAIEQIDAKIESADSKIKNIETKVNSVSFESLNGQKETPDIIEMAAVIKEGMRVEEDKRDPMEGYKAVHFDPEELLNVQREKRLLNAQVLQLTASQERELYKTESGELIGTNQGIVDGLEEAVVNPEVAKELGKPGITEEKIAELISGESEMLREAHVMGLTRVLTSHMQRDDDSSVDFKKLKPIVESLKDSEVLKALNDEMMKAHEERKKEEKKWTTFLQKPKRPVPRGKFGDVEEEKPEPYKVKIVKQPKPKVAPDYKPKDFNTGLLPWEERALREPTPPPVDPEEPILVPEEPPEILEAVDPLPESEVPDLEDSGIPLPPPSAKEPTPPPEEEAEEPEEELDLEAVLEETEKIVEENIAEEMEGNNVAEQIMMSVQNMVDPNASLEQQLAQMRAQLAALAQLPGVIQQSLELVTRQLSQLSQMEASQTAQEEVPHQESAVEEASEGDAGVAQNGSEVVEEMVSEPEPQQVIEEAVTMEKTLTPEELEQMRREEEAMLEEQRRMEKQKKEAMEQARLDHESRQVKQHSVPRVGKPRPVFGPATPQERPMVLPGGRRWRKPQDAYNEQFIAETLTAQAEIISGKAKGVNFMKYEKPPVSLDHLQHSDVYKMIHSMDQTPPRRVDMLTPVMAEEDYREKCRSMTPCPQRIAQQIQP